MYMPAVHYQHSTCSVGRVYGHGWVYGVWGLGGYREGIPVHPASCSRRSQETAERARKPCRGWSGGLLGPGARAVSPPTPLRSGARSAGIHPSPSKPRLLANIGENSVIFQ